MVELSYVYVIHWGLRFLVHHVAPSFLPKIHPFICYHKNIQIAILIMYLIYLLIAILKGITI